MLIVLLEGELEEVLLVALEVSPFTQSAIILGNTLEIPVYLPFYFFSQETVFDVSHKWVVLADG